jgi:ribose-phosphate pyrophosphokinase
MLAAIEQVGKRSQFSPICLAVHGLFADGSDALLAQAGAQVVTTNTVPHATSLIDVSAVLARGLTG